MNVVIAGGLLTAVRESDLQGQVIIGILALGSAFTWSVMLTKWQQLRRARSTGRDFLSHFRRERDPLHLFINGFELKQAPLYNIYRLAAEELSSQMTTRAGAPGAVNIGTLRNVLGRAIDAEVMLLESHLPVLSTAVQGGPFLGLLGSAWGVMSVFSGMAEQGTMRLQAVAPGISAALGATVVGLLVAVPSLFAYNWLAARVRHQTMEMDNFADEFIAAVEHAHLTN